MMNEDRVMEYDPGTAQWTGYPLPSLGAEARYISLTELQGKLQVVVPYYRSSRIALMTVRTPQELESLKSQAGERQEAQARVK